MLLASEELLLLCNTCSYLKMGNEISDNFAITFDRSM